jgi:hypothetical protein
MPEQDDIERWKKIQNDRLQARDPQAKQKAIQHKVAAKNRSIRARESSKNPLADVPAKWWGMLIGAVLGVVVTIVIPSFLPGLWGDVIGLLSILILSIVGFMFGQAIDVRRDLKELL